MAHALLAGRKLHKATDGDDSGDLTGVDRTHFRFKADAFHHFLCRQSAVSVGRCNINGAVLFNVDFHAVVGLNLLDHLAALTDDLSDLFGLDVHGNHLGRISANLSPRSGDCLENHIVDDIISALVGHFQSGFDDLRGQAVDLQIHLDGGDALMRAGNLEVHIAVEVFQALNVDHGVPGAVFRSDQTAGNAGNRCLDRHACCHEGQSGAADRSLRGGAVGGNNLGNHPDRIGELLNGRKHGNKRTLGQSAVTDLPSAGGTDGLCFSGGEAGHVVLMHISFGGFLVDGVQLLRISQGAQCGNGKHLRLSSGEHTGAMNSGQQIDLGIQRTDLIHLSAVHSLLVHQQPAADNLLLNLIDEFGHNYRQIRIFFCKLLLDVIHDRLHFGIPHILVVGVQRFHDGLLTVGKNLIEHIVIQLA